MSELQLKKSGSIRVGRSMTYADNDLEKTRDVGEETFTKYPEWERASASGRPSHPQPNRPIVAIFTVIAFLKPVPLLK
jgi:hypothetical protein